MWTGLSGYESSVSLTPICFLLVGVVICRPKNGGQMRQCRLAVNAVLGQHTGQRHEKGGHHAEISAKYRRKY